jgi:putative flavoprotein involved in K+ transport
MQKLDVLVIGAGQAGLAMAYHLIQTSLRFALVDGNARLGDSWRKRYDSLRLFTPRCLSSLSGLLLEGDPDGYASRDEFADYLERYALRYGFPIELNTRIEQLRRKNSHFCALRAGGEEIEARAVVLASGGFQKPVIPGFSTELDREVCQLSPVNYRNPSQVRPGNVLVVGDGATGRDIASELAERQSVYLATGKPRRLMPERILGISMWTWLKALGLITPSVDSYFGRKMREADSFPNRARDLSALRRKGIRIVPRLTGASGSHVRFQNDVSIQVSSVIWATGYRDDSDWVHLPQVKDTRCNFVHQRGVAPVQNLYFMGRPYQITAGSARIYGVSRDAAWITNEIQRHRA